CCLRDRHRALPQSDFATLRRDPRCSGRLPGDGHDVVAPQSTPEARAMTSDVVAESNLPSRKRIVCTPPAMLLVVLCRFSAVRRRYRSGNTPPLGSPDDAFLLAFSLRR